MTQFLIGTLRRLGRTSVARSLEYLRDGNSIVRTLLLPLTLIIGLAYTFSGAQTPLFKIAVVAPNGQIPPQTEMPFVAVPLIQFYAEPDLNEALQKVELQRIDMVLAPATQSSAARYWISRLSQRGELVERLLLSSQWSQPPQREYVSGTQVRYVDWMVPGILGLNIAMSSLFGIGTVIMSQRRSGYLKRLGATPLRSFEFLLAQLFSRLFVVVFINAVIFFACKQMLGLRMAGSYFDLLLVVALGIISIAAIALIVTARTSSEELGGAVLSLLFTLMMVVSGAFFSIDGAPRVLRVVASFSPMTQLLDGMRAIMLEGASLHELTNTLSALASMGFLYFVIASVLFKWRD